jgi:hypothetical protein
MIMKPSDYAYLDVTYDILSSDYDLSKESFEQLKQSKPKPKSKVKGQKAEVTASADMVEAQRMAAVIFQYLTNRYPQTGDFVFQGHGLYDPLATVDWKDALSNSNQANQSLSHEEDLSDLTSIDE